MASPVISEVCKTSLMFLYYATQKDAVLTRANLRALNLSRRSHTSSTCMRLAPIWPASHHS